MVHDEITVALAHETIGYTLAVLMMIAGSKGILTLSAEAAHQILLAILYGYHHKYSESVSYRFVSKGNGYLIMNHLYYYTPRNPNARIIIKASDPYGNTYTASSDEVTTEPFANFAHYYEKEYKEYKNKKDKMLRDSVLNRQKDSLTARKKTP